MNTHFRLIFALATVVLVVACDTPVETQTLPILGERDIVDGDTLYHQIPDFSFINQDSQVVTNATFAGKAYVADFFFTACPTICPMTTKSMLDLYDQFKEQDELLLLAHSIDTRRDSVPHLKQYAENMGVESQKWHLVTGIEDEIMEIADDYFSIAYRDDDAPGGFDHSGRLILVDPNRHVRSFCDGTDPKSVERFVRDIHILLEEMDVEAK
ncbi:MAG: SCO family protein [Bacteroidota bacterium]